MWMLHYADAPFSMTKLKVSFRAKRGIQWDVDASLR